MSERIFVSIAVSKPKELRELPGARTAARRMALWAKANGYQVVSIDDTAGPVTVDSIRAKLTPLLLQTSSLSRLIVFFAGHGSIKDLNDSFWLLSNWCTNSSEAIHVSHFQRMLRFYGPKQVTIIGDCCRVVHKSFLEVIGSAVLERPETHPSDFELDRFFAADAGEEAFMIQARGSNDAFCIFTEVLLDALEGDAPGAFEQIGEERAVTSGSLTIHLTNAVPAEARKHNVAMKPKPEPGFYTDRVYVRFPSQPGGPNAPAVAMGAGAGPDQLFQDQPGRTVPRADLVPPKPSPGRSDQDRARDEHLQRQRNADAFRADFNPADVPMHFETGCGLAVLGAEPKSVEMSTGSVQRDPLRPGVWFPLYIGGGIDGRDWANVIVELDSGRYAYVCAVQGFITTLQLHDANHASVIHRPIGERPTDNTAAVDALARANAGLLTSEDIVNTAAQLRLRKHADFTLGCVAAYLYNSIGDVESIRSIAAYYSNAGQAIPLDVALLSGGTLSMQLGRLFVDIPATLDRQPRTEVEKRGRFTFDATPALERVPVAGSAPWMRGGWTAVSTASFDRSALGWRERAEQVAAHLAPSTFTMVRQEGQELLADLAGVRVGQLAEI